MILHSEEKNYLGRRLCRKWTREMMTWHHWYVLRLHSIQCHRLLWQPLKPLYKFYFASQLAWWGVRVKLQERQRVDNATHMNGFFLTLTMSDVWRRNELTGIGFVFLNHSSRFTNPFIQNIWSFACELSVIKRESWLLMCSELESLCYTSPQ